MSLCSSHKTLINYFLLLFFLDPFDQRSAKQHVLKVQEVLENPAILANIFERFQGTKANTRVIITLKQTCVCSQLGF